MEPQKPLTVEVLAYAPTMFFHCLHCEVVWQQAGADNYYRREQLSSSLPADLQQDYLQLSDWVREMSDRYGNRILFKVVDAASIEGLWKSLRHGVHKYPAVVIGKHKIVGLDFARATELIRQNINS